MQIETQRIDIDVVLAEARSAAERGNVEVCDSALRALFHDATKCGTPLRESQLKEVVEIQKTARANGIERLLDQAEFESEQGLVTDCDLTMSAIRACAHEASLNVTEEQELRMRSISRAARINRINGLLSGAEEAAKYGRVTFVDRSIEEILRHAEECEFILSDEQSHQIQSSFRIARKKAIKQALKDGGASEDVETLELYAEEAGEKLTKKQKKKLAKD